MRTDPKQTAQKECFVIEIAAGTEHQASCHDV